MGMALPVFPSYLMQRRRGGDSRSPSAQRRPHPESAPLRRPIFTGGYSRGAIARLGPHAARNFSIFPIRKCAQSQATMWNPPIIAKIGT